MIWQTTIKTTKTFNFYWILKNQLSVYNSTRQVCIYLLDLVAKSKYALMQHANHIVLTMKNTSMFSEQIFTLIQSLRNLVCLFQTICSPFQGCLVVYFEQQFSVFKQYYTNFYTFFHSHVFLKNTNNVTRTTLPNRPLYFSKF